MNRKSKIILVFILLLVGAIVFLLLYQREPDSDFDNRLKEYTRQIERLSDERDSLYRTLATREQQYRHITDSLNAAIVNIQTAQTQNRTQYENRRDSIILLPDHSLYRMVTGYIERYDSHANSECDSKSRPEYRHDSRIER